MNSIREFVRKQFTKTQPLPAGMHSLQSEPDTEHPYRLHLRLEPDGTGILIMNAATVLHLNQTAAEYAYHLVSHTPQEAMLKAITARYNVKPEVVTQDYEDFIDRLQTLTQSQDLDPVTFLGFDRIAPYTTKLSAPYRLDCALTYRLSSGDGSDVSPTGRVKRELTTEEWVSMLDKAWQAGIPHVVFTGGEPTLRPDLIDLVGYTQKIGMVSGLLTDGSRLAETHYLHSLLQAGLDHLMILLDPAEDYCWEAIRDTLPEDIQLTVHFTLTPQTQSTAVEYLVRLSEMGVKTISLSASEKNLVESLQSLRQKAAELGLAVVWDIPVPYSEMHTVAFETVESTEAVAGAGRAWLYVEPDGDVLPAQGIDHVLGNLLTDPWETIWNAPR